MFDKIETVLARKRKRKRKTGRRWRVRMIYIHFIPPLFSSSKTLFANTYYGLRTFSIPSLYTPHSRAHVHRCVGNPGVSRCCRSTRQFRQSRAGDRFYRLIRQFDTSGIRSSISRESASKYQSSIEFGSRKFPYFFVKLTKFI